MLNRSLVRRLLPALLAIAVFASLVSSAAAAPTELESGANASCYLDSGAAYCWTGGTLNPMTGGPSNAPLTSKPVKRPGLTSGVSAISLSENTGCAVVSGAAKCWGLSMRGEVGNWDYFNATVPVQVDGLSSGVTDISSADGYSCAVVSGAVKCWGESEDNGYALGHDLSIGGGNIYPTLAHTIPTLTSGATTVEGGDRMACAIVSGAVKCWGIGYLGDGTNHTTADIATVTGLTSNVTALDVDGGMACAVQSGAVKCWGEGASMIDGAGSHATSATPVTPPGLGVGSGTTEVSIGESASCAIAAGAVKCWGLGKVGQLGNGVESVFSPPATVTGVGSGATAIATNRYVGCAIVSGVVKCWGSNERGLLGDGTLINALTPVAVPALTSGVTDISAGVDSTCAVVGGVGKCWGNVVLPTADPSPYTLISAPTPTTVPGLESGVTEIDASETGCAIVSGSAKCWERGINGNTPTLYSLEGATSGISDLDLTWYNACAVVAGAAKCGAFASPYGYLDTFTVQTVTGLSTGVTQVAQGGNHQCAIQDGAAKCWGYNSTGELGNGSFTGGGNTVQQVVGLTSGVTAISAGTVSVFETDPIAGFTCAIVNSAAKCWGQGTSGQLGNGASVRSSTPVQVQGLTSGVTSISAGQSHACAVKSGDVYCWGAGFNGELGNNTRFNSNTPVKVLGLPSTVTQVSAGGLHNCAIAGAAAYCWGGNARGQLGVVPSIGLKTATDVAAPGDDPSVGFVLPGDQGVDGNSVPVEVVSANAVSVQCKLDEGALEDCPSSYSNLSQGAHQIRAYAENAGGQKVIAYSTFTVDTVAPTVTILSPANGSVLTTNTPALYFEVDDPDSSSSCTLDGVELLATDSYPCSSLEKLPPLSAGSHTLVVTATDYYGNSSSTTSTFTYKAPTSAQPPAPAAIKAKAGLAGKAKKSGKTLKVGYVFSFAPPKSAAVALACSGSVKVTAKYAKKSKSVKTKLSVSGKTCSAKANFKLPLSAAGKKVTFDAFFAGNSVLAAAHEVTKLKIKT